MLNHTKKIKDMNLKDKTKNILAVIYSNYWCDNEKKEEFNQRLKENDKRYQEELKEKYSTENLFKRKEKMVEKENIKQKEIIVIEPKESIFKKLIKKIKSIFSK